MTGRKILVTGSSKGLGRALTEHFLQKGDEVYGCSRSQCDIVHDKYHHFEIDVSSLQDIDSLFSSLRDRTRVLDVLINNAGIASMNAFALTPEKTMRKVFDVNVHGTILFCQKALRFLKKSANPRIINMSTVAVPFNLEGESIYAASKSAVESLTRIIAKEYGHFGITCNAIGPSPIETSLIKGVSKDKIAKLIEQQAIKKMAAPVDVINIADFYLQPESHMVTGQVVYLGGVF